VQSYEHNYIKHVTEYGGAGQKFAMLHYHHGQWSEAEKLGVQILDFRKKVLGSEHPDTEIMSIHLGLTYWKQGRAKEAEELFMQLSKTKYTTFNSEHPTLLTIEISDLSWRAVQEESHQDQKIALPKLQLLESSENIVGLDHGRFLTVINNLAAFYVHQRRWKEADILATQVVELSIMMLGIEHYFTAISKNNLAFVWRGQGRYEEALASVTDCVQIGERTNHPHVASFSQTLAVWKCYPSGYW
jgi:tetratricopeptide (TPR) repeat protein